ncbi:unnamed protein product [Sphagnum balticum]
MSNNARKHIVKVDDAGIAKTSAVSRPKAAAHRMRLLYENKDTTWQFEIMAAVVAAVKTLNTPVLSGRVRVATKQRHTTAQAMPATKYTPPDRAQMLRRLQKCLLYVNDTTMIFSIEHNEDGQTSLECTPLEHDYDPDPTVADSVHHGDETRDTDDEDDGSIAQTATDKM